jgi:hypothetical protein
VQKKHKRQSDQLLKLPLSGNVWGRFDDRMDSFVGSLGVDGVVSDLICAYCFCHVAATRLLWMSYIAHSPNSFLPSIGVVACLLGLIFLIASTFVHLERGSGVLAVYVELGPPVPLLCVARTRMIVVEALGKLLTCSMSILMTYILLSQSKSRSKHGKLPQAITIGQVSQGSLSGTYSQDVTAIYLGEEG